MAYGFKVELDSVDISDKVSRFEVQAGLDRYCRELSLELADQDLYDTIDFGQIPEAPQIEVFTRVDTDWVSQGNFFLEKPTYSVDTHSTTTGLWGRSETALLGPPFAPKVSKIWSEDTSLHAICAEMCALAGLTWDPAHADIPDFTVFAYTFQAEGLYPAEVIAELLNLAYGEDAFLTTDRSGHVCLKLLDRSPTAVDFEITDPVTVRITEEPEWPDFANRVKISAAGAIGGFGVNVTTPIQCLLADGAARAKIHARVTDADGNAVNDLPISWSAANGFVTLDQAVTNTQTVRISDEQQRATSFTAIQLSYPPETVLGVWAYKDTAKSTNLAADGVTISGDTITLPEGKLTYCDQLVRITYTSKGVAVNYATTTTATGTETVTADIGGNSGSVELFLGNPCQCPPSISLQANPSSIQVGTAAKLLTYVEIAGAPVTDGRKVYNTIDTSPSRGKIQWTEQSLGTVTVTNEETTAQNEVSGVTQCELAMFPASVTGVWAAVEDEDGNLQKTGGNLYASNNQKLVNLTTTLLTGADLIADYVALGAAVNIYDGKVVGTDRIRAILVTTREERTEASTTITVSEEDGDDGDPEDCCNDGLCDVEEIGCDAASTQCGAGEIYGMKDGQPGCWHTEEADACGEGMVYCYKAGEMGCWPTGDCDTVAEAATIRCRKEGTEGCFPPAECDQCGQGLVYCWKGDVFGCYPAAECDAGLGGGGQVECEAGTVCCVNKFNQLRGCWPSDQCSGGGGGGGEDDGEDDTWDHKPTPACTTSEGTHVDCPAGQACCTKGGKRGCFPWQECDKQPDYCYSTDCHENPTDDCMATRFGEGLQTGGDGCSCLEMCDKEFSKYGTTQSYDGGSYRSVAEIAQTQCACAIGSPEFYELYETLKTEALDACRQQCGDCEVMPDLTLSGADAVTAPGGYQYVASGGSGAYEWSVSGTGATVDANGYVLLIESACGSYSVTVTDTCGRSASMDARVTNAGTWVQISYEYLACHNYNYGSCDCIKGKYKYDQNMSDCPPEQGLSDECGCPGSVIGIKRVREWVCA